MEFSMPYHFDADEKLKDTDKVEDCSVVLSKPPASEP